MAAGGRNKEVLVKEYSIVWMVHNIALCTENFTKRIDPILSILFTNDKKNNNDNNSN